MDIKEYIEEQIKQIEITKQIDIAKIHGFYDGATTALKNVLTQAVIQEDTNKKKATEDKKALKVAKSEE